MHSLAVGSCGTARILAHTVRNFFFLHVTCIGVLRCPCNLTRFWKHSEARNPVEVRGSLTTDKGRESIHPSMQQKVPVDNGAGGSFCYSQVFTRDFRIMEFGKTERGGDLLLWAYVHL